MVFHKIFVGVAMLLIPVFSQVQAGNLTVHELNQRADELKLSSSPGWLRLLHYPHDRFSNNRSRVDSADFFLSPTGAVDPEAEGRATVEAAVTGSPFPSETSPQCRYPARFAFFKKKLQLAQTEIVHCPELTAWLESFDAAGVSLVYADGYLNNPASMFGHTFLRVESYEFADYPLLSGSIGFTPVSWQALLSCLPAGRQAELVCILTPYGGVDYFIAMSG